ncbi:class C sortase [Leuconostoc gasicomitatum]|uniref:Class C sortase n=1 Tax=Leuconostoc gasicomitatum TaxID=115778 RepID=A0A9Q3SWH3_9LACO|nr:class C sortase [Leuconostoc gasicomitatum]MBZ5946489.1 class C sortase [Leuconostoc gasicomitatum]MBZ5961853.1 class C sortase [Leuconostoc gasicomitatum]
MTKKKRTKQNFILNLIFFIGFLIALYPFYVGALNHFIDEQRINTLQSQTNKNILSKEASMRKKNAELRQDGIVAGSDPFSGSTYNEHVNLKKNLIGEVSISKIGLDIPLFDTTNEETLNYGATVLQGTSFPIGGKGTHSVISAHRGLASRVLFTNLNKVKKNDIFVLKVLHKKLAYKVFKIQIVKPEDYQGLKIEPNKDLVTLLTCTPYMINSHRLLVTGYRVPYRGGMTKSIDTANKWNTLKQGMILIGVVVVLIGQLFLIYRKIVMTKLSKRKFDFAFYRLNQKEEPIVNVGYQLFSKNGKVALKRDGEPLIRYSNLAGQVVFDNLPGNMYLMKKLSMSEQNKVKIGVKKISDTHMSFYPKKRDQSYFNSKNGKNWIKW